MSKRTKSIARRITLGATVGAPAGFALLIDRSFGMDPNSALAFTLAVSFMCMLFILGAAFVGAYRFLKNVGLFKGHYYY